MPLHPQRERFQTAQYQKTVERARNRADRVLEEPHSIAKFLVLSDHSHATDDVGVTVQIFGCRMDHEVKTKFDRPLDPWRGEGVVGDRKNLVFARDLRDRFQIDDFEERIARRFDPNHSRVLFDRRLKARYVGKIDISEIEIRGATSNFFEKAKRS